MIEIIIYIIAYLLAVISIVLIINVPLNYLLFNDMRALYNQPPFTFKEYIQDLIMFFKKEFKREKNENR